MESRPETVAIDYLGDIAYYEDLLRNVPNTRMRFEDRLDYIWTLETILRDLRDKWNQILLDRQMIGLGYRKKRIIKKRIIKKKHYV